MAVDTLCSRNGLEILVQSAYPEPTVGADCPEHHIIRPLSFLPKETENGSEEGETVHSGMSPSVAKGRGLQFRGADQDTQSSRTTGSTHPWIQHEFSLQTCDFFGFGLFFVCVCGACFFGV